MNSKEVAEKWFEEVWNKKNGAAIAELMGPAVCGISEGCSISSSEEFKSKVYEPLVTAFPDAQVTIDGIIAENDEVATRWTLVATHEGPFGDIPASGRRVKFSGMTWHQIQDGKIVGGGDSYNLHGLMAFLSTGEESASVVQG